MCKKILLIVNPRAGKMKIKSYLPDIRRLLDSQGHTVSVLTTRKKQDATRIAKEHGQNYDFIICCGGDGTLNEIIEGIKNLEPQPQIGYIPCGTTNDFAKNLNISKNPLRAAEKIILGKPRAHDIGSFNQFSHFVYIAAFGAFTGVSYTTPQKAKNKFGYAAYFIESLKYLLKITPYHMKLTYNGNQIEDDFIFGAVSNSKSVAGVLKLKSELIEFDDGLLELLFVKKPKNIFELCATVFHIFTKQYRDKNILFSQISNLQIESAENIAWTLDGEFAGRFQNITIQNLKKAVTFVY